MEIRIQKDTGVSLHTQIVTQVSMHIASGLLRPGTKLPSIRALSQKLGIHHNTCLSAYRELSDIGLIELRHGSGARVKMLEVDEQQPGLPAETSLAALAEFIAQEARQRGYRLEEIQAALSLAYEQLAQDSCHHQLVFVDLHPDILPVFQYELENALQQPIRVVVLDNLNPESETDSHFLVSRYHFRALKEKLKPFIPDESRLLSRITVMEVGSGQQELGLIRQLNPGTMIGIVSVSSSILQQAEAVIRAVCGEDILIRAVLYGEEPLSEIGQVARRAKVLFADKSCLPQLQTMTPKRIQPIQTIPDHEVERIRSLLLT